MDALDEEPAALRRESDRVAESLPAMEDHHRTFPSRVVVLVAEVDSVRARAAEVRVPGEDVAGALAGLRGRFPEVAESDVEAAVEAEVARARGVLAHLTGSLDRRAELRGRLDAYRAKAAGRGFAEDAELPALARTEAR